MMFYVSCKSLLFPGYLSVLFFTSPCSGLVINGSLCRQVIAQAYAGKLNKANSSSIEDGSASDWAPSLVQFTRHKWLVCVCVCVYVYAMTHGHSRVSLQS